MQFYQVAQVTGSRVSGRFGQGVELVQHLWFHDGLDQPGSSFLCHDTWSYARISLHARQSVVEGGGRIYLRVGWIGRMGRTSLTIGSPLSSPVQTSATIFSISSSMSRVSPVPGSPDLLPLRPFVVRCLAL